MEDYFRYKRKNRAIYSWSEKLYIPVLLATKNEFARIARENRMSQAEFGALIVMHYLRNRELLLGAIIGHRAAEARFQKEERERSENTFSGKGEVDRTFGGVFKSSFGDDDET